MFAAASYLATKPDGAVLVSLVIAIVLFIVAAVFATIGKVYWAALVSVGLVFIPLAFIIH